MRLLITGAKGFVGKNLIAQLHNIKDGKVKKDGLTSELTLYEYDMDTNPELLDLYTKDCDFVFHLAGVNRPKDENEFMEGNFGFTSVLLQSLKKNGNKAPVLITSSIQAALDNPYGRSKKAGEDLLLDYGRGNGVKTLVYRLPNVFGKWCRPNYNSAVATFCHNIANGLSIQINDPNTDMKLVYIDDVVEEFLCALSGQENREGDFCSVPVVHAVKLGEIADLLYSFRESRKTLSVPKLDNPFEKALYSTYLSYLPKDQFSYPLKMNIDERGSFTEIIRTPDRGQFSVNISKPGITKGNHWHHTKNEKFVVVSGKGLIRFRKIGGDEVIDYHVSGENIEVVDIPTGYTHSIVNEGETDLVTFMWCNECFDPDRPDTYFEEVSRGEGI
ncbi:capsular polysaccharide biosynthesis protein CapF [Acetivibrio sp. MSJd-27]|uniref:capsular polysaccharide biosynthesis protein CapF n=1 Tax=Acetivibrio sp. MSJd-27 TaxID=2841523 RepID=UPI001C0FC8AC|nr:capsular polysaccharide biosynthesis protein CapF [Acetivibrio sp. MSJd-27]MBU5449792.1 capsular polysaccharide biosynthesis protein CapF [Acetivibrio sp. MSJd-27]